MNVFAHTRIKLTIWYVTAIMTVSVMFSLVIYSGVSRNIEQSFIRAENRLRALPNSQIGQQLLRQATSEAQPHNLHQLFIDELRESKQKVVYNLLFANSFILLLSLLASYILAGMTLHPIEEVLLEQKRFIADASHELRTPLTSLKTAIEVSLRDKQLSLSAKKILTSNLEDVNSLKELIDSLLQLASQENKTVTMQLIDIHELLSRVVKTMQPLAQQKGVKLVSKLKHQQVLGSDTGLLQLFTVLVDNAIKYTNQGGKVQIEVVVKKKTITISISDTGIGIHKKYLPYIFDRFYRVDASRTQSLRSGFGLGLSVAKQVITNHKGSILVCSEIGKGTTFTVTLPQ